ncbi:RagB/SusD family nutrient uptake outer membrane protein [Mucilaginibacter sp. ZT4R22]|uniref:RagB/SusD family nutrient uptake outer membrane protein n=1 Tax=Mucilaginibacter pankratovii TaxID=2772110 RepID=A0ABR7WKR4_9SPHI|nr:RagB/SusD family nutrient uptake outer membrane protein [Mucilaginibacter pankratovii]MBD1362703.1 RagB/SusD family nutrient uptake outer membrane protein [Mucilaginibacter pankratovii]
MKKKYILLMLLVVITSSCKKDFINLVPQDSLSPETFFQTDDQLEQAVAAAYVPLRDLLINDYHTSEMRSDNTHYIPNPNNRGTATVYRENVSDWNNDANNDYVNAVYYHCYTGISRSNIVIGRIPAAAKATDAGKARADGQAKFLRAWNYFKLVRLFGGVPLYLKEVTKAEDAFKDRSTADEVYAQIVSDAKDAISELLPPAKFPQSGEATKGSATMLLADVYVTQKKYAEAEALLNTLPAMGYSLNANYADAFLPTNKNGKESLFEVQYLEGTAVGTQPNTVIFQFLPKTTSTALITGTAFPSNTSGSGWNIPSFDLLAAYEPNDKRLDASIGIAEGTNDASFVIKISAVKNAAGYVPTAGKAYTPFIKKYVHGPYVATTNSNDDWPIYRYSEALLLLAEAQNEQGKSPLTALNAVRTRAGLPNVTESDPSKLRDIIMHERRVELAFENKRFHDIQRSATGLSIMQAYAAKAKTTYTNLEANAFDIQAYKFLFPVPLPERNLNPGMPQNPGYSF